MEKHQEDHIAEQEVIIIDEKAGNAKHLQKKLCLPFLKYKKVWSLSGFLLLVIIGLTVALIVTTPCKCKENVTETKHQNFAPCEDEWIWYHGKCYYFSTDADTWSNSQGFCSSHNASLAHIDNQKELAFLKRAKGLDNHWIGLRRTDDNKAWEWISGTPYNESLFKIERSSDEHVEHVFLNHEGVRSQEGTLEYKWICKKICISCTS